MDLCGFDTSLAYIWYSRQAEATQLDFVSKPNSFKVILRFCMTCYHQGPWSSPLYSSNMHQVSLMVLGSFTPGSLNCWAVVCHHTYISIDLGSCVDNSLSEMAVNLIVHWETLVEGRCWCVYWPDINKGGRDKRGDGLYLYSQVLRKVRQED